MTIRALGLARLLFVAGVFTAGPAFAACDTANVPPEMMRAWIQGTQEALNEHGFRAGSVDGKVGPQTRSAIRSYQKAAKLPVNGCVSQELLDHLNFAQPKIYR